MKPSIVVFDLGKVLVDFDYSIAGRRLAAQSAELRLLLTAEQPAAHRLDRRKYEAAVRFPDRNRAAPAQFTDCPVNRERGAVAVQAAG